MPELEFEKKNFLVIGSSSGIGLATAKALHNGGATVVLHGPTVQPNKEVENLISTPHFHYIAGDLSDLNSCESLIDRACEKISSLDGFVFAAGTKSHVEWEKISVSEWEKVLALNEGSFLFLAQKAAPHLRKSKGSIVAVSSTNAERVNKKNLVYDVSKAGLNHLIKALALELRDDGVRVNGVMPGGIDTPLLKDWLVDYAGSHEEAERVLSQGRADGSIGKPEDIADVITFLLSNKARWITGEIVTADFGVSLFT